MKQYDRYKKALRVNLQIGNRQKVIRVSIDQNLMAKQA